MTRSAYARVAKDSGPGIETAANLTPLNDSLAVANARFDAREGSEALLRAQLMAGQHLLALPLAQALGAILGMRASQIRAASQARAA